MRSRISGSLIFSLLLGITPGCSTSWKFDSLKEGIKFPSLSSLTRKGSDSSAEIEQRADQLVRIQEYAAAEDLYAEILQREPKNQTVQQKLTDLQWKKRGVEPSLPQQEIAASSSRQSPRDSERSFAQSSYRSNRATSTALPLTRDRVIIKSQDAMPEMSPSRPYTAASSVKPIERNFALDADAGDDRIPEWARDDAFEDELTVRREFTPEPAPRTQLHSSIEQQNPVYEYGDPFLRDEPMHREPQPGPSRQTVAHQPSPQAAPTVADRDEEWTIMIKPKTQSQQNERAGLQPPPGVINLRETTPRMATNSEQTVRRAPQPEAPAFAKVHDLPPQQIPSIGHPVSESFDQQPRSGFASRPSEPNPFPADLATPTERLNTLSDTELQERLLNHPHDSAAVNEVFQRLTSPNRETRWQAANTIEVLAFQPESEAIVLAGFARSISDTDPALKEQVLKVLQGMPEQSTQLRDLIRKNLDDENEHVRAAAEAALDAATN